jgi:hypothetical protein
MNRIRIAQFYAAGVAIVLLVGCSTHRAGITAPPPDKNVVGATGAVLNQDLTRLKVFPPGDPWNQDISDAPLDPRSQYYIDWISERTVQNPTAVKKMLAYFGPPPFGIPYVAVSGTQALLPVDFVGYPRESDAGAPGRPPGYPIPDEVKSVPGYIEGNRVGDVPPAEATGDRHMIVVDRDNGMLYETYIARWNSTTGHWEAESGATYDLATGAARPEGWTSADAAGLPIFPGLVRYDEAYGTNEITHAFRINTKASNGHVWPATHTSSNTSGAPPLGIRLRLKASVDLSAYPPEMQRIFRAMKTYGLIVADNGDSDFAVSGTMDSRWNRLIVDPAFESLHADDFEIIQFGWGRPATGAN